MKNRIFAIILIFMICPNGFTMGASQIGDFKKAKQRHEVQKLRAEVLEEKYRNLPKEDIVAELGKPSEIIKKEFSYFTDSNCHKNGCPEGRSDEVWIYDFKISDERGLNFSQIWVYIKEDKIVKVGG
jgi:hypothetical protein